MKDKENDLTAAVLDSKTRKVQKDQSVVDYPFPGEGKATGESITDYTYPGMGRKESPSITDYTFPGEGKKGESITDYVFPGEGDSDSDE